MSLALAAALCGCAGPDAARQAQTLLAQGHDREALDRFAEAARDPAAAPSTRLQYLQLRERLLGQAIDEAEAARGQRQFEASEAAFRRALSIDPVSARALAGLRQLDRDQRRAALVLQARQEIERHDLAAARTRVDAALLEQPDDAQALALRHRLDEATSAAPKPTAVLAQSYRKPITLEFRDVPIKTVFELISRTSGLNFVFDHDVRVDQKTSIFMRDGTTADAISRVLLANQLEQRVLDGHSVLIYPDTAAKRSDYQQLSIKAYYLENAEAKVVGPTLKSMLKLRDLVVDERLNLIVVRDTPDAIRLADRLVALYDLVEPEVMLDVEVLEVKRSKLMDLGIRWPAQVGFSPLAAAGGTQLTLNDLMRISPPGIGVTVDPLTVTARTTVSDANLLAHPRIRVKSRSKANVLIGDRVPVITSTSTSTGFVSDSVTYVDVGLKLEAEPVIHRGDDVSIRLSLEVSSLVSQVQTKSGTLAYQIGTRNASTTLRLHDGENQVLAGLVNDEERKTADKLPGLGDAPLIGRLFGGQADDKSKTEIVLSITPHLIRNAQRPEPGAIEFESGTESSLRAASTDASPDGAAPPDAGKPAVPPASKAPGDAPGRDAAATDPDFRMTLQGPADVRVGQSFVVEVAAQPRVDVKVVPFAMGFDPTAVEVLGVTAGEFFGRGGAAGTIEQRVDPSGQILITAKAADGSASREPGRLVSIQLRALAADRTSAVRVLTVAPVATDGAAVAAELPPALQFTTRR